MSWHAEILDAWLSAWTAELPGMLAWGAGGAAMTAVAMGLSERTWVRIRRAMLLVSAATGLALVIDGAAVYDDAFISFRYAENWAAGLGPVFNAGERVEGYTNFLWTALLAGVTWLTPVRPPEAALVLCPLIYLANLAVVWRLSTRLSAPRTPALGLSVILLAVQDTFTDFGTSGLETGLACLLTSLGVLWLITAGRPRQVGVAGLLFTAAALARPDHGLFYAVGSAVALGVWGPGAFSAGRRGLVAAWHAGGAHLCSWGAPFALYAAHTLWRLGYYGQLLPNTYYAKSAGGSHLAQGLIYAESFYLGSHMWLVALLFVFGLSLPAPTPVRRRFRAFAAGAVVLYNAYVVKVGGDFMYGRFYVPLIPLLLLGAELAVAGLAHPKRRSGLVAAPLCAALLMSTAGGLSLLPERRTRWHLNDESSVYPVTRWFPVEVDHSNFRVGQQLGKLQAAGFMPLVATSGVGMLGYHSRLPIVDRLGLVDPVVAHLPIDERGRPGHEKLAPDWYIRKRNPHFIRGGKHIPLLYRELVEVRWLPGGRSRGWMIYHYDSAIMAGVARTLPKARFTDFEAYLDRYLARAHTLRARTLARDLAFFRGYYFDHNEDPPRLRALQRALALARDKGGGTATLP